MSVLRRGGEGLLLLTRLATGYAFYAVLGRVMPRLADRQFARLHERGGEAFAAYARRHGALMIKLGQYVASRPDFFPLPYVDACAALRDQAPARPFAAMLPTLERGYEGRISEHLSWIDETPLASASFGQVHRARLTDGRLVAVKIQYPDLGPAVAMDLRLVCLALRIFQLLYPAWPLHLIGEEISRTSREEQDYLNEGLAADRLRPVLERRGLRAPAVLWPHTRERILVMEFAAGTTLSSLDVNTLSQAERESIASRVIDAWLDMLTGEGLVHGDPHAGNLIRSDDGTIWILDFGMTVEIGATERTAYRRFLGCLSRDDVDGMVEALARIGVLVPGTDKEALRRLAREIYDGLGKLDPRTFKGSRRESELTAKVFGFLSNCKGLVFPRHTVVLSRGLGLVEGLCMDLMPGRNLLDLAKGRLSDLASPWAIAKDALAEWGTWLTDVRRLPGRIEAALAPRAETIGLPAILCAILLLAALQLDPGPARTAAAVGACLALLITFRRR